MATYLEDKTCIFCAIIKRLNKEYRCPALYAELEPNPVADGHTLVIPKYHAKTILDLPDEYLVDIAPILKKIAKATGAEHFNILQNNGVPALQFNEHVYFQVIPKPNREEGIIFHLDENWPAKALDKDALEKTAEKIKAALA